MDIGTVSTPATALMAGFLTGIHCCGMCGPLTCAAFGRPEGGAGPALAAYHASRLLSYAMIGGLLGVAGQSVASLFSGSVTQILPWAFAGAFLLIALGLEKRIPVPGIFSLLFARLRFAAGGGLRMAGMIGLATPFLPCGPLYMVFGVALFAGSFAAGATLMAAFALGTVPVFVLFQSQILRLQGRFSPRVMGWFRQGFALVAAVLLAWRAAAGGGHGLGGGSCPMCH